MSDDINKDIQKAISDSRGTSHVKENRLCLEEVPMMIFVPESTIEVTITAKIYYEGELVNVYKGLSITDVRELMNDAKENYIDPNEKYYLTDLGRECLEQLEKGAAD